MFNIERMLFLTKEIKSKNELFDLIAKKAIETNISDDYDAVLQGLKDREEMGTTGFIDGFGIPHCKTDKIKEPSVIFIRSEIPIEWDSMDGKPLTNMFSLLIPEAKASEHLKMLAQISRKLMSEEFRENIRIAKTPEEILSILKEI